MSHEQEDDAVIGRLIRERGEEQKRLSMLQAEARKLSQMFDGLGKVLDPDRIWNIAVECYEVLLSKETLDQIRKLKKEIPETQHNLQRLNAELQKLGA